MNERHFNRILNREPEETLSEAGFVTLADAVRGVEAQAGVGEGTVAESDILPEYTVQRYDGPDGLVTVHISWMEDETFVTMDMRNDYGPHRNQCAGTFTKLDKAGGIIEERTLSDQDLAEQTVLVYKAGSEDGFRSKKLMPHILSMAA